MEFMKPFGEFIEGPDGYVFQSPHDKYSVILNVEAQVADSIQIDTSPTVNGRVGGLVTKQLKKALNCVGCGGCIGVCPNYAITVSDAGHFRIDEEKCSHCLKCVTDNFVERGCLALMSKSDIQIVSKQ